MLFALRSPRSRSGDTVIITTFCPANSVGESKLSLCAFTTPKFVRRLFAFICRPPAAASLALTDRHLTVERFRFTDWIKMSHLFLLFMAEMCS